MKIAAAFIAIAIIIGISTLILVAAASGIENAGEQMTAEEYKRWLEAKEEERKKEDEEQLQYLRKYAARKEEKENARKLRQELHRKKSHRHHHESD